MSHRLVEVDYVGNGEFVGEGCVFFDEKALDEPCAYFDRLKIQSGAVHCRYWERADDIDGPNFSEARTDAAAELSW